MKILIDSLGLQARIHAQDGMRLSTFLTAIERAPGWEIGFSTPEPISEQVLADSDILLITTRKIDDNPYTEQEIKAITTFVRGGGGLLLMANHGDVPGRAYPNLTTNDNRLALQFGIEIENSFFAAPNWEEPLTASGPNLASDHPVMAGVALLVFKNAASLRIVGDAQPLVGLPDSARDYRDGRAASGRYFAAVSKVSARTGQGRVIVTADSGFIGSKVAARPELIAPDAATRPGFGLLEVGDNLPFLLNALRWLGRENR